MTRPTQGPAPERLVAAAAALAAAEARFTRSPNQVARRSLRRAEVALARAVTTHHNPARPLEGDPS